MEETIVGKTLRILNYVVFAASMMFGIMALRYGDWHAAPGWIASTLVSLQLLLKED